MKILSIAEIGLNHFGKINYLDLYLKYLLSSDIDGITIQVLKKEFYIDNYKSFKLSKVNLIKFVKKIKKANKLVGIVTDDMSQIKFFNKLKVDFYKVLSVNIKDIKLIKKLLNTNCSRVYLSTGLIDITGLKKILSNLNKKKISLIHTSFGKEKSKINLSRIKHLKFFFKLPICYGNHSRYTKSILDVKKYNPYAIFFYVKLKNKLNYPDNIHAIKIDKINKYIL